jgi:hypothetical protein
LSFQQRQVETDVQTRMFRRGCSDEVCSDEDVRTRLQPRPPLSRRLQPANINRHKKQAEPEGIDQPLWVGAERWLRLAQPPLSGNCITASSIPYSINLFTVAATQLISFPNQPTIQPYYRAYGSYNTTVDRNCPQNSIIATSKSPLSPAIFQTVVIPQHTSSRIAAIVW